MPVFGLVVTLESTADVSASMHALERLPGVTVGARVGGRVAVVVESDGLQQERQRIDAVSSVERVGLVELTFADFSDIDDVDSGAPYMKRRLEVLR